MPLTFTAGPSIGFSASVSSSTKAVCSEAMSTSRRFGSLNIIDIAKLFIIAPGDRNASIELIAMTRYLPGCIPYPFGVIWCSALSLPIAVWSAVCRTRDPLTSSTRITPSPSTVPHRIGRSSGYSFSPRAIA